MYTLAEEIVKRTKQKTNEKRIDESFRWKQ